MSFIFPVSAIVSANLAWVSATIYAEDTEEEAEETIHGKKQQLLHHPFQYELTYLRFEKYFMNPAFFRLDLDLSVKLLQDDLSVCEEAHWISHYNQEDYTGGWSSISLRSGSGASEDIYSVSNKAYVDTPLLSNCPYFREVTTCFKCEKEAIRLLRLEPGGKIKEHADPISFEDGFFRIHIPIVTNEQVTFSVNKELVPMKEGECWYANFELPHSVENHSNRNRVHLVIDCRRNEWSDNIFLNAGFDLNAVPERCLLDDTTKLLVINELLRNPTETNLKLAATLRSELDAVEELLGKKRRTQSLPLSVLTPTTQDQ